VAFMKNECRAARRLNHPNIVSVYDFHQQDDLAFMIAGKLPTAPIAVRRSGFWRRWPTPSITSTDRVWCIATSRPVTS
jgi:hypothetical protein